MESRFSFSRRLRFSFKPNVKIGKESQNIFENCCKREHRRKQTDWEKEGRTERERETRVSE